MNSENPYSPPQSFVADISTGSCQREGRYVVVPTGSDLPPRCIICNEPAETPIKQRKLYWHSPWLYVLILINILLYAIVSLFVRKSAKASPGFCAGHKRARKNKLWRWFGSSFIAALAGLVFIGTNIGIFILPAFVLSFILLIPGLLATNILVAKEINKDFARYAGCKEPFLQALDNAGLNQ
jgi:hypothetical protein